MSVAINAFYLIVLCVCGWRTIYRVATRHRGAWPPFDALLWLSAVVLVLIPGVADSTNATGWSDPDTLYPMILSVGWVVALLAWDVWSVWSRAHENRRAIVDEDA